MVDVSCYNCGSNNRTLYATENGCSLAKCTECGLLYVSPRPSDDEIEEGIKIGVHRGETALTSTGRYMPLKVAIYHKVLRDIYGDEFQNRKQTWLDVGCGHGELLVALKGLSKDAVLCGGIEPNEYKIAAARKRGLDVSFFNLASHDKSYDTISLLNVYSHLPNPREFFELVRQRLTSGGEILLETGDTANLPANLHPRPFLLPDHLSFGSEQVITNMLKQAGFKIVSVKKYPAVKLRYMKVNLLKDLAKALLPHTRIQFSALYGLLRATKYKTDMWIRARTAT